MALNNKTRIAFNVSYDGTNYYGWQRQKQSKHISIASCLESALEKLLHEKVSVYSSGRTDAGVHARDQWCHFSTDREKKFFIGKDLSWALKAFLPSDIVIKNAYFAPPDFHSLHSAVRKTYRYWVWNNNRKNPLFMRYSAWERRPLDLNYLNQCCEYLIGEHDFKSFQSVGTELQSTQRTIFEMKWQRKSKSHLEFTVTGDGFLKQMVRNIVGTQIFLFREGRGADEMLAILKSLDRQKAHAPAEPQGLFLDRVYYPKDLKNQLIPTYQPPIYPSQF